MLKAQKILSHVAACKPVQVGEVVPRQVVPRLSRAREVDHALVREHHLCCNICCSWPHAICTAVLQTAERSGTSCLIVATQEVEVQEQSLVSVRPWKVSVVSSK